MNIVLLSGGSGKRLWPLSNEVRSKQFLKMFKSDLGTYESMLQRMYRGIRKAEADASITVATSKKQVPSIINQIGSEVQISIEPERRDTFPAVFLAMAYMHDVLKMSEDETVVVCPVDTYAGEDYFKMLRKVSDQAEKSEANIVLLGINPTYPSDKYGYIIPQTADAVSGVDFFKEKPTRDEAAGYIEKGALWNAGVYAFRIGYILKKAHELINFTDYYDLYNKFSRLAVDNFSHAIVEDEQSLQVLRFNGKWEDVGTWNTLTDVVEDRVIGKGTIGEECENLNIVNELGIPVLAMGIHDAIIAASPDGILVSDKNLSRKIKPYIENIDSPVMFAEKTWGDFRILDSGHDSLTAKVTMKAGESMNYHSHKNRDEVWVITSGRGTAVVDGMEQQVNAGDVITMQAGCRHIVKADTDLELIEVQLGKDISADDKLRYTLE